MHVVNKNHIIKERYHYVVPRCDVYGTYDVLHLA